MDSVNDVDKPHPSYESFSEFIESRGDMHNNVKVTVDNVDIVDK